MSDKKPGTRAPVPVYMVRHGVTAWTRDGLVQAWTDIPLSDTGRAQAERLAMALHGIPFGRIITSSLCRASETAGTIARGRGISVETFPDLREYGCGVWEGRPYLEV